MDMLQVDWGAPVRLWKAFKPGVTAYFDGAISWSMCAHLSQKGGASG
jgi:hypothetical protein